MADALNLEPPTAIDNRSIFQFVFKRDNALKNRIIERENKLAADSK